MIRDSMACEQGGRYSWKRINGLAVKSIEQADVDQWSTNDLSYIPNVILQRSSAIACIKRLQSPKCKPHLYDL